MLFANKFVLDSLMNLDLPEDEQAANDSGNSSFAPAGVKLLVHWLELKEMVQTAGTNQMKI